MSIARRLQDPLAELVKIEPKAIGVGQYQHDVDQGGLARSLDAVVEDCVNSVGVDVNTASAPLLARVSGLNQTLAANIVAFRDENGAFKTRTALEEGAAPRAEGVRAGGGLPAHHERQEPARCLRRAPGGLSGGREDRRGDQAAAEVDHRRPRVPASRSSPRRSPTRSSASRPSPTSSPSWRSPAATRAPSSRPRPSRRASRRSRDLKPGMQLEGVVTNVAAFGAFVDVGVHQDGLVHISELADRFVKDPREVVKAGDVVKVRVKEVDVARKRIALTMKSGAIDTSGGARARSPEVRADAAQQRAASPSNVGAAGRKRTRRRPAPRARTKIAQEVPELRRKRDPGFAWSARTARKS